MAVAGITETTKYVTFKLAGEIYALQIDQVREVLDLHLGKPRYRVRPISCAGVINLRGSVVPLVDLRLKFGLPSAEQTVDTRIVIVELSLDV